MWAVRGVVDYFRCNDKIIAFPKKEEAQKVASLIGKHCEIEKVPNDGCWNSISIDDLRKTEETE